jgi:hypothetical protein
MTDLVFLILENGDQIHCADINDAKSKAIANGDGRITVEITPGGAGGPVAILEFDRSIQDWLPLA